VEVSIFGQIVFDLLSAPARQSDRVSRLCQGNWLISSGITRGSGVISQLSLFRNSQADLDAGGQKRDQLA